MKKVLCLALILVLTLIAFTGCGKKEAETAYTKSNEIVTYCKIDPGKTQLVISRTGNIDVQTLCDAFEEKNPDIQIVYIDITGGNSDCKPLIDWVTKGYAPDIVVSAAGFFNNEMTEKYIENLSMNPIIEQYEAAALKRTATNGDVYWLPGPSNITAMMYNKTLFEQYGWKVPNTFDEFVKLCVQIREDTNGEVEPWNPNAKYDMELLTVMEGFVYEEVFGGVENRTWYNEFIKGNGSFIGHMEPYYDALETLIENGLLRDEHFTYSATTRGKEFLAAKIAMINYSIYDPNSEEFEFGYMPIPTTKGELGYLCDKYSCYIGVPQKERSEKENDAVTRFLEYFSSVEGQQVYIGNSMKVSNVKNVPLNQTKGLSALKPAIDEGHLFAVLEFVSEKGVSCNLGFYEPAKDMTFGTKTKADVLASLDRPAYNEPGTESAAPAEVIATAKQDMTILETSFYIADMYRETAGADIGLIANNEAYRGNLMRVFSGDLSPAFVTVLKPRSFANNTTLIKVAMTGQQIMEALNHPLGNTSTVDCIYAYSGLKCEVAPWNELGKKYLSVKLADGSALDLKKTYTVACWDGTVAEEYITEIIQAYEGTFETLMTEKMKKDGTVSPANDGRITLKWN